MYLLYSTCPENLSVTCSRKGTPPRVNFQTSKVRLVVVPDSGLTADKCSTIMAKTCSNIAGKKRKTLLHHHIAIDGIKPRDGANRPSGPTGLILS